MFYAKLPATGNYQVGVTGFVTESGGSTGDNVTCLVIDRAALDAALGGGSLDLSKVYAITETASGDSTFGILNYTNHAQKIANKNIGLRMYLQLLRRHVHQRATDRHHVQAGERGDEEGRRRGSDSQVGRTQAGRSSELTGSTEGTRGPGRTGRGRHASGAARRLAP